MWMAHFMVTEGLSNADDQRSVGLVIYASSASNQAA